MALTLSLIAVVLAALGLVWLAVSRPRCQACLKHVLHARLWAQVTQGRLYGPFCSRDCLERSLSASETPVRLILTVNGDL